MDEHGEMEWPSKRIPPGGIFHNHRVEYTPETQQLIKVLMEESKLTLMQRKKVDWCLRSGDSLPNTNRHDRGNSASTIYIHRPKTSRRRSLSAIKSSGDFERDRYRPNQPNEDREIVKRRLQEIMEYGRNADVRPHESKIYPKNKEKLTKLPTSKDILNDLLDQIKERAEWLEEMEALGEAVNHREAIRDQIAERFKKIETLYPEIENHSSVQNLTNNDLVKSEKSKNYMKINKKEKTFTSRSLDAGDSSIIKTPSSGDKMTSNDNLKKHVKAKAGDRKTGKDSANKAENIADSSLSCSSCVPSERTYRSNSSRIGHRSDGKNLHKKMNVLKI